MKYIAQKSQTPQNRESGENHNTVDNKTTAQIICDNLNSLPNDLACKAWFLLNFSDIWCEWDDVRCVHTFVPGKTGSGKLLAFDPSNLDGAGPAKRRQIYEMLTRERV